MKYLASVLASALAFHSRVGARRAAAHAMRADSMGGWERTITEASRSLMRERPDPTVGRFVSELTKNRRKPGDGFEDVDHSVRSLLRLMDADDVPYSRSWVGIAKFLVYFRNKTRGHGAWSAAWQAQATDDLSLVTDGLMDFLATAGLLFASRTGERRWLLLADDCREIVGIDAPSLAGERLILVAEDASEMRAVGSGLALLVPAPEEERFYFANGSLKSAESTVEYIEYLAGDVTRLPVGPEYLTLGELPRSRTAGHESLVYGRGVSHNLPRSTDLWVERPALEGQLIEALCRPQFPVVTLHGMGGSGKTALALRTAQKLAAGDRDRFDLVLWLSARDLDLLPEGIIETQPEVSTLDDMAGLFVALVGDFVEPAESPTDLFRRELAEPTWRYLIVADNFETLDDPEGVQQFIAQAALAPTKVLITSRRRSYAGDLPIEVGGLEVSQAEELMVREGRDRFCESLLTPKVRAKLFEVTDGLPYPLKLAVAQIASGLPLERVLGQLRSDRSLLEALFRRSFDLLEEPARYFALLVGNSQGRVPELLARTAVARRGYRFADAEEPAVGQAVVTRMGSVSGEYSYSTPSTAREFLKLEATLSELSERVTEDTRFVREYRRYAQHPGTQYAGQIAREIAGRIFEAEMTGVSTEDLVGLLEHLGEVEPAAFIEVCNVRAKAGEPVERQIEALRRGLEVRLGESQLWYRWAELERGEGRVDRAFQLLRQGIEASEHLDDIVLLVDGMLAMSSTEAVKEAVWRGDADRFPALRAGAAALEGFRDQLDPTQMSKLAWLYLILGNKADALELVFRGLRVEPSNRHLVALQARLRERHPELFGR